jgi:hypothetical protein
MTLQQTEFPIGSRVICVNPASRYKGKHGIVVGYSLKYPDCVRVQLDGWRNSNDAFTMKFLRHESTGDPNYAAETVSLLK